MEAEIDPRDREWVELILWLRKHDLAATIPKRGSPYFIRKATQ